jgi:hypothetical protein
VNTNTSVAVERPDSHLAPALMRSPVPARVYVDPDILDREQARLFRRLWIFAGLK